MNYSTAKLCSSLKWKEVTQRHALPWTLEEIDLGSEVLEIGPGYGVLLRKCCCSKSRTSRLRGIGPLPSRTGCVGGSTGVSAFDAKMRPPCHCCKAHHSMARFAFVLLLSCLGSVEMQNMLFAEVSRVLRPGAVFAGTDSPEEPFHATDSLVRHNRSGESGNALHAASKSCWI